MLGMSGPSIQGRQWALVAGLAAAAVVVEVAEQVAAEAEAAGLVVVAVEEVELKT